MPMFNPESADITAGISDEYESRSREAFEGFPKSYSLEAKGIREAIDDLRAIPASVDRTVHEYRNWAGTDATNPGVAEHARSKSEAALETGTKALEGGWSEISKRLDAFEAKARAKLFSDHPPATGDSVRADLLMALDGTPDEALHDELGRLHASALRSSDDGFATLLRSPFTTWYLRGRFPLTEEGRARADEVFDAFRSEVVQQVLEHTKDRDTDQRMTALALDRMNAIRTVADLGHNEAYMRLDDVRQSVVDARRGQQLI